MGIAVLPRIAFNPISDSGLIAVDASHLFEPSLLNIVFRKHGYITRPVESFLSLFAPHIDMNSVLTAMEGAPANTTAFRPDLPFASRA